MRLPNAFQHRRVRQTSISPESEEQLKIARVVNTGWLISDPESPYYDVIQPFYLNNITGKGITIAIVDSGVDPDHPMLVGKVHGTPFSLIDNYGHGTAQATIAAGSLWQDPDTQFLGKIGDSPGYTSVTHRGVAYDAEILSVRILNKDGEGSIADMARGIHTAAKEGAQIINISAGVVSKFPCSGLYCEVCRAANYARHKGAIVIAATGNDGPDKGTMACPARHRSVIAVGAEDIDTQLASFSGRALFGWDGDIRGPGGNSYSDGEYREEFLIVGSTPESTLHQDWNDLGSYMQAMQGTSPATAFISGYAALLLQREISSGNPKPDHTVFEILKEKK